MILMYYLRTYRPNVTENNKFISIMAGLPISYIREKIGADNPIARIMPNTNAHVGHSVTGISFSNNFGPKSKEEVDDLINAFGSAIEVSEDNLHQVTAITGSGPAFLYHVFEQYVICGHATRFREISSRRIYP